MTTRLVSVITTIQEPTDCVRELTRRMRSVNGLLISIGDTKGPARFESESTRFVSYAEQLTLPFQISRKLPTCHYTRKNIGYLLAMAEGADCIYETDDDNRPNENWRPRQLLEPAQAVRPRKWINAFRLFTEEHIWPRGFPLECILDPATYEHEGNAPIRQFAAPVQQGLADGSPDVDAVWRLVLDHEFKFRPDNSIWLPEGTWCPFNSQTTWWWREAWPLMYLPSYCTFRCTDIWRSFVVQRCLWAMGHGLIIHGPEVYQERNQHILLKDFDSEVPGYLRNAQFVNVLESLQLKPGTEAAAENVRACYAALVEAKFFPSTELELLDAWLADVSSVQRVTKAAA